ncbi:hypothetical protein GAP32_478 [Cronobacter phage vB_CsaM_GAP32]|uniref:Uncharacterized protein n=1 Tax=Cronobacter phage vB_CsaM_GAP32 TaxID=1141136 RepID=K4F6N5_9CAUD|nr:hypothetical protein GAP32_478 [Cronobacter phage vB_CsaM_GAP32]AFC21936.1 hypothetical protein GAP32_478 [Cronobacter phage vB_CsaM_GAP32]
MFLFVVFFIAFQLFFAVASGGVAPRLMYALTVSNGFLNFLQNYALSYQVSYDQIHSTEKFLPEVNSKLERLLSLVLIGKANVGISVDYRFSINGRILRIEKPHFFDGSRSTVHFHMDTGTIDGTKKYALSPTVFILAEKVYKMQTMKESQKELEQKRNII